MQIWGHVLLKPDFSSTQSSTYASRLGLTRPIRVLRLELRLLHIQTYSTLL